MIGLALVATTQVYLDVEAVAAELKELAHDADSNVALCGLLEKVRGTFLLCVDWPCSEPVSVGMHACM